MKKKNPRQAEAANVAAVPANIPSINTSPLRADLAIGIVALAFSVLGLYILNYAIYTSYHPDIDAVFAKVMPVTIFPEKWFHPEPVERLQYQLSLLALPFLGLLSFLAANKMRKLFTGSPALALTVNIAGILAFFVFIAKLMEEQLVHLDPAENNTYFFNNNLIGAFSGGWIAIVAFYLLVAYLFIMYYKNEETRSRKNIAKRVCFAIVALVLLDVFLYDLLNLAFMTVDVLGETNAVFYAVTQVYAGKSLLVDFNAQYGLYAWILNPVFKLIGLSTYKFGIVMGILNSGAYLFLYLGIRKMIKKDILSLIVFLCLVFWSFWFTRIPSGSVPPEGVPRVYFQYWPLRLFFPALIFYLLTLFFAGSGKSSKILLSLIALSVAFAILWNLDTGVVVFGATVITLLFAAYHSLPLKDAIKKGAMYLLWMGGALLLVIGLFFITTKIHSGVWPDFARAFMYQGIYYISGYFMLPMCAFHFWNIPVLVYVAACIYCVRNMRKEQQEQLPLMVFLFILGAGLFSYFQGRSYDTTVTIVMYPAIIMLGVFCDKLYADLKEHKAWLSERAVICALLFLFLVDGAFSMAYQTPSIHEYGMANLHAESPMKEEFLKKRLAVMTDNVKSKDTVLILSRNYESFCYAAGDYVNPMNQAGSTEVFFKTDLDTIVSYIKTCKYPIVYDGLYKLPEWYLKDTLIKALVKYADVVKQSPDHTMFLLKPRKTPRENKLKREAKTVYYSDLAEFRGYSYFKTTGGFENNFNMEFIIQLDSSRLNKENILFTNASDKVPFSGILIQQSGDDLTQYKFAYGNGSEWTGAVYGKLSCTTENHLLITVRNNNVITMYNNDQLCGQATGNGIIKNSDNNFYVDFDFPGVVREIKIQKAD